VVHVLGFSGEDGGFLKLNAVSQVDGVFSYDWLVWMFKTYVPLMFLQPGVHGRAHLPNVDLATLTRILPILSPWLEHTSVNILPFSFIPVPCLPITYSSRSFSIPTLAF
jgi:hypothetical protein